MNSASLELKRLASLKRQREEAALYKVQMLFDDIHAQQSALRQTLDDLDAEPEGHGHLINPTHLFRLSVIEKIRTLEAEKLKLLSALNTAKLELRKALYSEGRISEN